MPSQMASRSPIASGDDGDGDADDEDGVAFTSAMFPAAWRR